MERQGHAARFAKSRNGQRFKFRSPGMYTRILKLVLAPPGRSRIFSCWSNTGQKYVWGLRKTQFSVTVPKNPPHHLRVEGRGLPLGLQRHFPCAVTTAPLALHKTGRYVCLWASGVQGPIAFLSPRVAQPGTGAPDWSCLASNPSSVMCHGDDVHDHLLTKITGAPLKCAPHSAPGVP